MAGDQFAAFKAYYANNMESIMAVGPEMWGGTGGTYAFNWPALFTPIEMQIWYSIRDAGIVMYPQFPIGPYFADFANPHKKVVIECDGAQWHSRAKDAPRDKAMAQLGWKVYRIPGKRCFGKALDLDGLDLDLPEARERLSNWSRTGDALIKAVAFNHFGRPAGERLRSAFSAALSEFISRDCLV